MKQLNELGLQIPQILLPKNLDIKTWSVIACDQYTQDEDYWKKAEQTAGNNPSTLRLILPEVYLNSPDKNERIQKIRATMNDYLNNGVFNKAENCFVAIERKTAFGRTRKGLLAQIDLDTYEWKPFSKANIRATEATIVERIPPRMEIRKGAPLELPHIMLLVNDREHKLVEGTLSLVKNKEPLYSGELMNNGGSIKGWKVSSKEEIEYVRGELNQIAEKNTASDGSIFLFAVGDGNHSLATAKAVWEEHKRKLLADGATEDEIRNSRVKYALVEIVNLYDEGLTFEPIHRVIFNTDSRMLIKTLAEKLGGKITGLSDKKELEMSVKKSSADFGFTFMEDNQQKYVLLTTDIKELAVARLQPEIDSYLKTQDKAEIDYIHGSDEVLKLGERINATGILLPPIAKDSFFETINGRGPLPRKSFSMGEADEKRFYLECRKLFG
ncbi:MAG: DUF1015 domain-containing protein [Treponema sp.]|nr:DUF1015 domain-containing protein [Treponema sp.]